MEKFSETKKINVRDCLTWGIRCKVYAYLPLLDLINTICKLSWQERTNLVKYKNLIDQPKNLLIKDISNNNFN